MKLNSFYVISILMIAKIKNVNAQKKKLRKRSSLNYVKLILKKL